MRIGRIKYFNDLQVNIHDGDAICEGIYANSVWEEKLSLEVLRIAREGGTFVDVGANIGYFSLLWCKSRPENESLAFEASPRIYPQLVANVKMNGLMGQVQCLGTALGDSTGVLQFVLGPEEQTGWGGLMRNPGEAHCKVVCVRLDQILDQEIRLLKIDVEGADTLVLKGSEGLLKRKLVREIFYEQNKPRMAAIGVRENEAHEFLQGMGYKVVPLVEDPVVSEWHAYLP